MYGIPKQDGLEFKRMDTGDEPVGLGVEFFSSDWDDGANPIDLFQLHSQAFELKKKVQASFKNLGLDESLVGIFITTDYN